MSVQIVKAKPIETRQHKNFKREREIAKWMKPLYKRYDEAHGKEAIHKAVWSGYKNAKGEVTYLSDMMESKRLLEEQEKKKYPSFYKDFIVLSRHKYSGIELRYSMNVHSLNFNGVSCFSNGKRNTIVISKDSYYYFLYDEVIKFPMSSSQYIARYRNNIVHKVIIKVEVMKNKLIIKYNEFNEKARSTRLYNKMFKREVSQ